MIHSHWQMMIVYFAAVLMYSKNTFSQLKAFPTDKNNTIDVAGNYAPDGIVGPYHEKEGSFYTIREIWSPVQCPMDKKTVEEFFCQLHNVDQIYTKKILLIK